MPTAGPRIASQYQRVVKVHHHLAAEHLEVSLPRLLQTVDPETVLLLVHLFLQSVPQLLELSRIYHALEHGLLYALAVCLAHLGHPMQPPTARGVLRRYVVGNQEFYDVPPSVSILALPRDRVRSARDPLWAPASGKKQEEIEHLAAPASAEGCSRPDRSSASCLEMGNSWLLRSGEAILPLNGRGRADTPSGPPSGAWPAAWPVGAGPIPAASSG